MAFRPGLHWPSDVPKSTGHAQGDASKSTEHAPALRICVTACLAASHGGEDAWQEREAFRSQGAKLIFIADTSILDGDEAFVHLVSFSSTAQMRVVSSSCNMSWKPRT